MAWNSWNIILAELPNTLPCDTQMVLKWTLAVAFISYQSHFFASLFTSQKINSEHTCARFTTKC